MVPVRMLTQWSGRPPGQPPGSSSVLQYQRNTQRCASTGLKLVKEFYQNQDSARSRIQQQRRARQNVRQQQRKQKEAEKNLSAALQPQLQWERDQKKTRSCTASRNKLSNNSQSNTNSCGIADDWNIKHQNRGVPSSCCKAKIAQTTIYQVLQTCRQVKSLAQALAKLKR